jgi:hypothetical protein
MEIILKTPSGETVVASGVREGKEACKMLKEAARMFLGNTAKVNYATMRATDGTCEVFTK